MSEHNTHELPDARPFEERILTRLDSVDARLSTLEDKVERRLHDTRSVWETVLARLDGLQQASDGLSARLDGMERKLDGVREEMGSLKEDMRTGFRNLGRKLEILNEDFLTIRGDIRDLDRRVAKLEESRS